VNYEILERVGASFHLSESAQQIMLRNNGGSHMATRRKKSSARAEAPFSSANLARVHLDTIRTALGSDRAAASILGVSPSQVSRWRRGQIPDVENADRLAGFALVIEMLFRWLEPSVIGPWLHGVNAHLGDRSAANLLRRGQVADVIGAIEAEKAGAYA
jgi:hypothetical protein